MGITALAIGLFTNGAKRDHSQGHRKGKGYHCFRPRHYNTDNGKTICYRCQQCQKTRHRPNQRQYFRCSESQPSSLLSDCDNSQLAGPNRSAASLVYCHSSSPACFAKAGYSLVDWGIHSHNSQEAPCAKQHITDHGGESPEEQNHQHQLAVTSTNKCRSNHSRYAAAHVHHYLLAQSFLLPNRWHNLSL